MATVEATAVLLRALASSTAHGVSHAALAKGAPLRVMWSLLFIVSLVFYLYGAVSLVNKLIYQVPTKTHEIDKVPFEFPDLYFCPTNPYSGSFPYTLTAGELRQIVLATAHLVDRCRELPSCKNMNENLSGPVTNLIHMSLPVYLSTRLLAQRRSQSVLGAFLFSGRGISNNVTVETFSHPENLICFRTVLSNDQRRQLRSPNNYIQMWLSTDPYFSEFSYNGSGIRNIRTDGTDRFLDILGWHPAEGPQQLKASGFTVLFVPPGTYPSIAYEHSLQLAPGNDYSLKVSMTENTYSKSLSGTHCVEDPPKVSVRDQLTHERVAYSYSQAYCNYQEINKQLQTLVGCLFSTSPVPWELRQLPLCGNLSEMTEANLRAMADTADSLSLMEAEKQALKTCLNRVPCNYQRYSSSFSFDKWPSLGSAAKGIVDFQASKLSQLRPEDAPALVQLFEIATRLNFGNDSKYSAAMTGIFRSYVSESLLRVKISSTSTLAAQVTLDWACSLIAFLAESGGLIGLYIGCSLLTLFEVFELAWALCCISCRSWQRSHRRSWDQSDRDGDETEHDQTMQFTGT